MLTIKDAATHFSLNEDSVRRMIARGELRGIKINRKYLLSWSDIWACERGPMPSGKRSALYQTPLLTKKSVAAALTVSTRTVERWIQLGLPTRNVSTSVRFNQADVSKWITAQFGTELPRNWISS